MAIASVVSRTSADGVYLSFISEEHGRREIADTEVLTGCLRLVHELKEAGLEVTVSSVGSDVVLWKHAGATHCSTGKFWNLRRFTPSRWGEEESGGATPVAYWFEESLLAFVRQADIIRIQQIRDLSVRSDENPFGQQILAQQQSDPSKPWVGLGWRQFLWWFGQIESLIASGDLSGLRLIRSAERAWEELEDGNVFLDESRNDGRWLRPWVQALASYERWSP
jgi:hypothetical protein